MNDSQSQDRIRYLICFIIIFLPFLLFYWELPFLSKYTIGSDYIKFSISHQLELLFSIKSGSVPLYVPGFASGNSSSALTLGQFFHPISHIASIMPGYWDGKAIEWNTLLKLLSLGFTQLVLFAFLRKIRLGNCFSFLLSFITVYNLRLIDLLRHGAPMEAYTALLILSALIGWYFIRPTKFTGPLSIICVTYLLVCSGHPEEMYYGMLGTGLFILIAPYYLSEMLPEKQVSIHGAFNFWVKTGFFIFLGILLSSVYIVPFYLDFIAVNADRVTQTYEMANSSQGSFVSTLNNFFFPLRSQATSAFGGSLLILIPAMLPVLRAFRIKIPRSVWVIWGICIVVFLHMQGSSTPVHKMVWQYLPLAGSIRDAGRISMILPFFMMLLTAWIIKPGQPSAGDTAKLSSTLSPLIILSSLASFLLMLYYFLHIAGYFLFGPSTLFPLFSDYFANNFDNISLFTVEIIIFFLGMGSLLVLVRMNIKNNSGNKFLGILLVTLTIMQVGIVIKYRSGNWIEKKVDSPTLNQMYLQKRDSMNYRYYSGYGFSSVNVKKQLEYSFLEPFLGKIFTEVIPVNSQDEAYKRMQRGRLPQQVFVEGYNPEDAKRLTKGAKNMMNGNVKLIYSSFNKLQFNVHSEASSIFGFSYPYTKNWKAWLNGKKVRVYPVNGAAHGIEINEGDNIIEFRYWSDAFFWGMIISCVTFALIGCFVSFRVLKGLSMTIGIISICVIAIGVFGIWYNNIYSGDNLDTEYTWDYTPPLEIPNLAYGKKNWLGASAISSSVGDRERELYIGRFVDGDRSQNSGFATRLSESPAWFLDLFRVEKIKTIILYKSGHNLKSYLGPLNTMARICLSSVQSVSPPIPDESPMIIELSNDGNKWSAPIPVEFKPNSAASARIVFDKPVLARYIKTMTPGKNQLSFDELEIYGSQVLE